MGTVLVTGSTGAVGGSAATELVRAQHHLVLLGRDLNRLSKTARSIEASQGGARVDTVECDLSSLKSVRTAASEIVERFPRIDGLVNAAAVFVRDRRLTADGFETMFATNHLGPFLLTNLLLERLTASAPARVVTVSAPSTSQLDFDDLGGERHWGALTQFGRSKMANLLFAYALARRQPPAQLTSNIMFPGLVRSGLMKEANVALRAIFGAMSGSPESAGKALAWLATDPTVATATGQFYRRSKVGNSSAYSYDTTTQDRLWSESARLVGLPS